MTDRPGRFARGRTKDALRVLERPLLGYFDKRFQEVSDRLGDRLEELSARVGTDVETMSELTLSMQRSVAVARRRVRGRPSGVGAKPGAKEAGAPDPEELFAVAAAGRLPPGARILHVGT